MKLLIPAGHRRLTDENYFWPYQKHVETDAETGSYYFRNSYQNEQDRRSLSNLGNALIKRLHVCFWSVVRKS